MRAKQSKFGKRSKPISKQILKTQQTHNRANFENKTEKQFQSSYAVYHKPSRSGREGNPFPYKDVRYIQDGALKTGGYRIHRYKINDALNTNAELPFIYNEKATFNQINKNPLDINSKWLYNISNGYTVSGRSQNC